MKRTKELLIEEGIDIIQKITRNNEVISYFKSEGFEYIFPEKRVSMYPRVDGVDVFIANSTLTLKTSTIKKCEIRENMSFNRIEFYIEDNFKICFEYKNKNRRLS